MPCQSAKGPLYAASAHAGIVGFLLIVGWFQHNLVFALFVLLFLDFPWSLIFASLASKLFPPENFVGSHDPYAMGELIHGLFHLVIGLFGITYLSH